MPGSQSDANISAQREEAVFWCGAAQLVCFCPTGHKDAELVALEGAEKPLYKQRAPHSQREQTGLTSLDGCSGQVEAGERGEVSAGGKWEEGFHVGR